jgi:beta-lactam-binding protein with PASTA domain
MHDKLPTLAAFVVLVAAMGWVLDRFFSGSHTTVTRNIHKDVKEAVAANEESDN